MAGLKRDESSLDEIRTRTGTLMSAATIGTAFLAAVAASPGGISAIGVAALGLFAGNLVICILILWPWTGWKFFPDGRGVIASYVELKGRPPAGLAETHRGLAVEMSEASAKNRQRLRWLYIAFEVAAILLVLEIGAWIGELLIK